MSGSNKALHTISFVLLIVGGLNWGLFALFGTDVGAWVGGMTSTVAKVIYILVALAAVYEAISHTARCKDCNKGPM
jgi:hypothetical protein